MDLKATDIVPPTGPPTVPESKAVTKSAPENYKRAPIAIPHFSGEVADWQAFRTQFDEAVHSSEKLPKNAKMAYLRDAMDDPSIKATMFDQVGVEDYYDDMVAYLKKRFDRPRVIHMNHCRTLADMEPIKLKQGEIRKFADTIYTAVNGLIHLGQTNLKAIATSLTVSLLPDQLRYDWKSNTERSREVPDVFELIEFLRLKSDNPAFRE